MSEEEAFRALIVRIRAGDREAAAELIQQYEPEIRRLIRLHLNHSGLRRNFDSGDIFQSVFLHFYVNVIGDQLDFTEPTQLLRLLATMVRNRIIDHARRRTIRTQDAGSDLWNNIADSGASPSDAVTREETLQLVLRRLTPQERDLVRKRGEGRSWQELADEYGTTPDALRKRLAKALELVRQELDPHGGGDA